MASQPRPSSKEQKLLRNARREGLLIMAVWLACLLWSVGSAWVLGYHKPAPEMSFILGMPSWIFWSVFLPWGLCLVFSGWFCFFYMADDDLGKDPDERQGKVNAEKD